MMSMYDEILKALERLPQPEVKRAFIQVEDVVEAARIIRKAGGYIRRIQGKAKFHVYSQRPRNGILPMVMMVLYVDMWRVIQRGRIIPYEPPENFLLKMPELKMEHHYDGAAKDLLWRIGHGYAMTGRDFKDLYLGRWIPPGD